LTSFRIECIELAVLGADVEDAVNDERRAKNAPARVPPTILPTTLKVEHEKPL